MGLAVLGLGVAGILTWTLWPQPHQQPRARTYLAYTACLLTDDHGLTGDRAAAVWAGMQSASLATKAKVQYLPVVGPATPANAGPYLGSLIQRHCDLIIAVGPAQVAAVTTGATQYPKIHFVTVGTADDPTGSATTSGTPTPGMAVPIPSSSHTPPKNDVTTGTSHTPGRAPAKTAITAVPWSTATEVQHTIDTIVRTAVHDTPPS